MWKILTIDSVSSSNKIIELISENLHFDEKKLLVFSAESLEEGKKILNQYNDIAVIIVDAIMEGEKCGFDFINFIRDELGNRDARIILRTGYADSLPERHIVQKYEIDGYISKEINSELQVEVSIITAIRSYNHIISTKRRLKSLAGSIAHELRNPLNNISLVSHQIKQLIQICDQDSKKLKEEADELVEMLNDAISSANKIINFTLLDLNEKPFENSELKSISVVDFLRQIQQKYCYSSQQERQKVQLQIEDNFTFKASPIRLELIIYNLLKNALYYLNEFPDSSVIIGCEKRKIDENLTKQNPNLQRFLDAEVSVIYVYDSGPGIAPEAIKKLFSSFYSSGKSGGTGLGLAFCKRNMQLFGGEIICESEVSTTNANGYKSNGWTKFSLIFPN